jgi:hypothetical protein
MNLSFPASSADTVRDSRTMRTPIFAESVRTGLTNPRAVPNMPWVKLFGFFYGCVVLTMFLFAAVSFYQVVAVIAR